MTITAKIIADSISPQNIRITTLQLRYPKFIHGELMTHRVFSRNASSSRAIPTKKMMADIIADPAMPIHWGRNQKGMQAGGELEGDDLGGAKECWLDAMEAAVDDAKHLMECGLHKQIANRILEPWLHINTLVTATKFKNFFELRRHKDAQPEIRALADAMHEEMQQSTPQVLHPGMWHSPYTDEETREAVAHRIGGEINAGKINYLINQVSVARCARVSYLTQEGKKSTVDEDLELYERLMGSTPLHASPAEHQATPDVRRTVAGHIEWQYPLMQGNFHGWKQFRRMIPNGIADR